MSYNAENPSIYTEAEVAASVGMKATLPFTGEIIDSGVSSGGPYVKFKVDEIWGMGNLIITTDLDALTRKES